MTTLREAAQQALEALKLSTPDDYAEQGWKEHNATITALRAALAEPVQEPVAWLWRHRETGRTRLLMPNERTTTDDAAAWDVVGPLYLNPPQRKPLTDEKVCDLWSWSMTAEAERTATTQQHAFARAIERAHGIGVPPCATGDCIPNKCNICEVKE